MVPGAGASGEEAVGDGLGVEVGELFFGQAGDEVLLKSLVEPIHGSVPLGQFGADDLIAQEAGAAGQGHGERFRRQAARGGKGKEGSEEACQGCCLLSRRADLQPFGDERTGQQSAFDGLAVAVEAELVEIGQDDIGEGVYITLQLLGGLNDVQFGSRRFSLNVADDVVGTIPDAEIRVAGFGRLGQHGDLGGAPLSLSEGFEQVLQEGIVGLLAGVAALGEVRDRVEIGFQRFIHHPNLL